MANPDSKLFQTSSKQGLEAVSRIQVFEILYKFVAKKGCNGGLKFGDTPSGRVTVVHMYRGFFSRGMKVAISVDGVSYNGNICGVA
jgi:hypothetical protein